MIHAPKKFSIVLIFIAFLAFAAPYSLKADFDPTNSTPPSQTILIIYSAGFGDNPWTVAANLPALSSGLDGSGLNFTVTPILVDAVADGIYDDLLAAGVTLAQFDQVWDIRFHSSAGGDPIGTKLRAIAVRSQGRKS